MMHQIGFWFDVLVEKLGYENKLLELYLLMDQSKIFARGTIFLALRVYKEGGRQALYNFLHIFLTSTNKEKTKLYEFLDNLLGEN